MCYSLKYCTYIIKTHLPAPKLIFYITMIKDIPLDILHQKHDNSSVMNDSYLRVILPSTFKYEETDVFI